MTDKPERQFQTAIRLPKMLIERFDKLAKRMTQPGGMPVTRSEVLRRAAFLGLEQLESEKVKRR